MVLLSCYNEQYSIFSASLLALNSADAPVHSKAVDLHPGQVLIKHLFIDAVSAQGAQRVHKVGRTVLSKMRNHVPFVLGLKAPDS